MASEMELEYFRRSNGVSFSWIEFVHPDAYVVAPTQIPEKPAACY